VKNVLERTWKESDTLQFWKILLFRHWPQEVKKICTFIKSNDFWADIWIWVTSKTYLKCLLSHSRATYILMYMFDNWELGSHPVAVVQYTFTHKQYTEQTIHRTTQKFGRVRAVPHLCGFYPGISITTEEKVLGLPAVSHWRVALIPCLLDYPTVQSCK